MKFFNILFEIVKKFKEEKLPISEQSLEQKALNNIKTLLHLDNENIHQLKDFLRMLREDIIDYGTLPDYTLLRIANLKITNNEIQKTIEELEKLKKEIGEDYLMKEKERIKTLNKEIIIAIENQKI